ncbi:Uncharacterised protein [Mycoplasmoides gallisepticum]|nr:Uncharacterised protein [Mycoplasmoides gallisepticum]
MIFKNKQKVFEHVNFLAQDKLNTELDKHI